MNEVIFCTSNCEHLDRERGVCTKHGIILPINIEHNWFRCDYCKEENNNASKNKT